VRVALTTQRGASVTGPAHKTCPDPDRKRRQRQLSGPRRGASWVACVKARAGVLALSRRQPTQANAWGVCVPASWQQVRRARGPPGQLARPREGYTGRQLHECGSLAWRETGRTRVSRQAHCGNATTGCHTLLSRRPGGRRGAKAHTPGRCRSALRCAAHPGARIIPARISKHRPAVRRHCAAAATFRTSHASGAAVCGAAEFHSQGA
jgi:hypothetical protein